MGYNLEFEGDFFFDKEVKKIHMLFINTFMNTRHMRRKKSILPNDPLSALAGLGYGFEGEFFVASELGILPDWNLQTHKQFNAQVKSQVLTVMCVQRYKMQTVDKNIFYQIISYMIEVSQEEKIYLLDFEREDNLRLFKEPDPNLLYQNPHKESVIDSNEPPRTQPGLWCQWMIEKEGEIFSLKWNGCEKFYYYVKWLEYLITNFIKPWNYILNGSINIICESDYDNKMHIIGTIVVTKNIIRHDG